MKNGIVLVVALAGIAAGATPWPQIKKPAPATNDWVILVGGDTDGYLAPCGCTKPMSGGIKRRASAYQLLRAKSRTLTLENGGLIQGEGRQDEMKAETMAQFLHSSGVDALHLTPSEARLGRGMVLSLARLFGAPVLTTSVRSEDLPIVPTIAKGPFLVGGISSQPKDLAQAIQAQAVATDEATDNLIEEAKATKRAPIVLFAGSRTEAQALAQRHPGLLLVVYRSAGAPASSPFSVGRTWLVSPGEHGKAVLRLSFADGKLKTYAAVPLGPEIQDEPTVARYYRSYLGRVSAANLLDALPREETLAFGGTKACNSCHQKAHAVWIQTKHATALRTLESVGHDRDPDCISCHVVGLSSKDGFRSRSSTPNLANVGCESCHGPSKDHSLDPKRFTLPSVGEKSCRSCHVPDHSPGFDFLTYWRKIAHN